MEDNQFEDMTIIEKNCSDKLTEVLKVNSSQREKEVAIKTSRSDRLLDSLMQRKRIVVTCAILIVVMCLFKLGPKQAFLDHCVEYNLYPAINKVFDGLIRSGEVTWKWTEMYQHAVGRSPLYTGIIELGLRTFGLTTFGIRIYIAIIWLLVYAVVFYTIRKYYSSTMAVLAVLLTLSAPWSLVMLRSGGAVSFGVILVTLTVCLWALMFLPEEKQPQSRIARSIILVGGGICTAILPYTYAGTRMFPILIILLTLISIKKLKIWNALQFFVPLLLIVSIQFFDISNALKSYFGARGEGLFDVAKAQSADDIWGFIIPKIGENISYTFKYLLGLNQEEVFLNINLADSYAAVDVVLFPKFLVPFLWVGIILHIVHLFKKKKLKFLVPILFLGTSLIPGLMSGLGLPNLSRIATSLPFIYYFIAYTFWQLFKLLDKIWDEAGKKVGIVTAGVLICAVLA